MFFSFPLEYFIYQELALNDQQNVHEQTHSINVDVFIVNIFHNFRMEEWGKEEICLLKMRDALKHQLNRLKIEEVAIRQKISLAENQLENQSQAKESDENLLTLDLDPDSEFKG